MAAGSLLALFLPFNAEPPATLYAPLGFLVAASGLRPYLSFDGTTDWNTIFSAVMPPSYTGRGISVTTWVTMSGNNSGTKKLKMAYAFERDEVGVALGAGGNDFAAAQAVEGTVDNTGGNLFQPAISFLNSQVDSVAAGDYFRFRATRNNATAGTNATGAARVLAIALAEI